MKKGFFCFGIWSNAKNSGGLTEDFNNPKDTAMSKKWPHPERCFSVWWFHPLIFSPSSLKCVTIPSPRSVIARNEVTSQSHLLKYLWSTKTQKKQDTFDFFSPYFYYLSVFLIRSLTWNLFTGYFPQLLWTSTAFG